MGKTSNAAKDRYNAKAYDDIRLRVPKGEKARIQAYADVHGESVNALIWRLIQQEMERDCVRGLKTAGDEE